LIYFRNNSFFSSSFYLSLLRPVFDVFKRE
jgi:hypothetical protein